MGLRGQAETDLGVILADEAYGFGWPIILTAPDATTANLVGFSNDVAQVIDPDTGMIVSGRTASVAIRISNITQALVGKGIPRGISNSASKPWIVDFNDINGNSFKFKVSESFPDRALGIVTCNLELYE